MHDATKVLTQPPTSYSEVVVSKDEQGLNVKPCSQTLIKGFFFFCQVGRIQKNIGIKLNIICHFPFRSHHSNTDCMERRLYFMYVLTLGLIFSEEIEPCQIEIQNSSVASSMKL